MKTPAFHLALEMEALIQRNVFLALTVVMTRWSHLGNNCFLLGHPCI